MNWRHRSSHSLTFSSRLTDCVAVAIAVDALDVRTTRTKFTVKSSELVTLFDFDLFALR